MESIKSDKQQLSNLPMIIVMAGPSNYRKSEIARKLAAFLRYHLIDEEDIIPSFKDFYLSSYPELPFKIISQISKTQLVLKLQIIVNTPLSVRSQFDDLLELANSKKAHLIIVECTSVRRQAFDYDVGNVPKLSIDTRKPFFANEFVSALIEAEESNKKANAQKLKRRITPQRCFTEAHAHEFAFKEEPELGSSTLCCKCQQSVAGPTYQCIVCDDFILHESCAQSQADLSLTLCKKGNFYVEPNPSEYEFPEEHKCKLCEYYSSECNDCLLQSHIKWGMLPTVYSYENHTHPFSFVIMPFWFNYEYKCIACEKYGKSVSYKCYSCFLDLHPFCAFNLQRYKALGPWGIQKPDAKQWDDGVFSGIRQLKLYVHFWGINAIQIEYVENGRSRWSDLHGEHDFQEIEYQIKLDFPEEYLTSIEGHYNDLRLSSLTFTSNKRRYGPYKASIIYNDQSFSSHLDGNKIVGFHGSAAPYGVQKIGIHIEPV